MKISVIGAGNLGGSFIRGLIHSDAVKPEEIKASDPDEKKLEELRNLGISTTTNNREAVSDSEIVFVATKPSLVPDVLESLNLDDHKLLVSLAAGVSTELMNEHTDARIIRVMPNICVSVGEMASAYALSKSARGEDGEIIENLLEKLGRTVKVDEDLMDAVTGLSGSGPAYVFLFIEALKKAGTEQGLSEDTALKLAAQTVKGSAELVLNTEKSLEELIDIVSSPKGTTIEGMKVLESENVSEALEKAVSAATERSKELSK